MKHSFLRRLGALTLALAMALSLTVVPAMAAEGDVTVTISGDRTVTDGKPFTLTATVNGLPAGVTPAYQWTVTAGADKVTLPVVATQEVTVTPVKAGTVEITVTAAYEVETTETDEDGTETKKTEQVTVTSAPYSVEIKTTVTNIGLNKSAATIAIDTTETLTITKTPADGIMSGVTWTSTDDNVATVSGNGESCVVTAHNAGTAIITATTTVVGPTGAETARSAQCTVTVPEKEVYADTIYFPNTSVEINPKNDGYKDVSVVVIPSNCTQIVEWSVEDESVVKWEPLSGNTRRTSVRLRQVSPGETKVTAKVLSGEGKYISTPTPLTVTVTGIKILNPPATLKENQDYSLQYKDYGQAATSAGTINWSSSDPSTVSVSATSGRLLAVKPGTVTITLTKRCGNISYTDTCRVTVGEDTASIINAPGSYNAGKPLVMSTLTSQLKLMSLDKTEVRDASGKVVTAGSPLFYINTLSVPTSQGTLYINYNSEANTGAGVSIGDRFYPDRAPAGYYTLSQLTFVPRQGFSGTAEITFNALAENNANFSGTIRVPVNGTGNGSGIFYGGMVGQPTTFLVDDFNAYCRFVTGRDLNYVYFSLPSANVGTLYYNYTGSTQYGSRVSASTQYSRTGTTNIGNVSFVPAQLGTVQVSFRGVNTAGTSFTGTVEIVVSSSSTGNDSANVFFIAQDGKQVTLRASEFNTACRNTLNETLSYVRFQLPASNEGVLYYNYNGSGGSSDRVDTATRYYYSGTPGINNITFVAAANAPAQIAVPYTGYSTSGATYTGTMYIDLRGESQQTIHYSVNKNGLVAFNVNDFNNVCLRQTGYSMDYVVFQSLPSSAMGTLYYNYRSNTNYYNTQVYSGNRYYRTATYSSDSLLGNISFRAESIAGTVTIPYTVYANTFTYAGTKSFSGTVVIQVGMPTPADINLSGTTASQIWLSSSSIRSACNAVMNSELAYIELTSLPGEKEGRVYRSYSSVNNKVEAKTGERYYRAGSPSIDQLSFIPYGGFNGTAVVTYVGYSSNGAEQVSGQIKITITNSTTSRYFNDMSRHAWAADAVDFLYANKISDGIGGGRFGPSSSMARGDFVLMLVRTFGLTSSGTFRYNDVPANSYYASAISTARMLGIISGSGNFYPKQAITRQDAMVMLYNALNVSGKKLTNGLAADLSGFSDRDSIANYARNAVGALVQMGVVKGDGNGRLRPTGTLNRAETAILLQYVLTL